MSNTCVPDRGMPNDCVPVAMSDVLPAHGVVQPVPDYYLPAAMSDCLSDILPAHGVVQSVSDYYLPAAVSDYLPAAEYECLPAAVSDFLPIAVSGGMSVALSARMSDPDSRASVRAADSDNGGGLPAARHGRVPARVQSRDRVRRYALPDELDYVAAGDGERHGAGHAGAGTHRGDE